MPAIPRNYTAFDIAIAFYKASICTVNTITIQKNGNYNRLYIGIHTWHDTEVAYNFISKLYNPSIETRFVYDNTDELWTTVLINQFPHKLIHSNKKNITTFKPTDFQHIDIDFTENYAWVDLLLEKKYYDYIYSH